MWICSKCTYNNPETTNTCDICTWNRPTTLNPENDKEKFLEKNLSTLISICNCNKEEALKGFKQNNYNLENTILYFTENRDKDLEVKNKKNKIDTSLKSSKKFATEAGIQRNKAHKVIHNNNSKKGISEDKSIENLTKRIIDIKNSKNQIKAKRILDWEDRKTSLLKKEMKDTIQIENDRLKKENKIDSFEKAIELIESSHGIDNLHSLLKLFKRIITRIINNPNDKKYLRINIKSSKIEKYIFETIGGIYIFKEIGFKSHKNNKNEWIIKEPYIPILKRILQKINNVIQFDDSLNIKKTFNELGNNLDFESIYYICITLIRILDNLLYLNDKSNVSQIDLNKDSYKCFIKPYPSILNILIKCGFNNDSTNKIINEKMNKVNCNIYKIDIINNNIIRNVLNNINIIKNKSFKQTNIYKQILIMKNKYGMNKIKIIIKKFIKCIDRIINEPLNIKIGKINLIKFYRNMQIEKIDGKMLFAYMGFDVDKKNDFAIYGSKVGYRDKTTMDYRVSYFKKIGQIYHVNE